MGLPGLRDNYRWTSSSDELVGCSDGVEEVEGEAEAYAAAGKVQPTAADENGKRSPKSTG